jgi:hypothetical protein
VNESNEDCVEDGESARRELVGKQSGLVLAGRYHDGSEMARILSDADTKALPRPLV